MDRYEREMASRELGCKPSEVVDLTDSCMEFAREGTQTFLENCKHTDIFEMSFNDGDCITVRVVGESEHSTPDDRKFDVVVIKADNGSGYPLSKNHQVGGKRWVRAYDLRVVGTYSTKKEGD